LHHNIKNINNNPDIDENTIIIIKFVLESFIVFTVFVGYIVEKNAGLGVEVIVKISLGSLVMSSKFNISTYFLKLIIILI